MASAEVLRVEGKASSYNMHVIELTGKPSTFLNEHSKSLIEHINKAQNLASQENYQAAAAQWEQP